MNAKLIIGALLVAFGSVAMAEEAGVAVARDVAVASADKSRAEIRAEAQMWRRAGLDRFAYEGVDQLGTDYAQAKRVFERLMNGPEYRLEVQRQEASPMRTASGKTGGASAQ